MRRTAAVFFLVAQGLAMAFASVAVAQAPPPATPQSVYPNPVVAVPPASLNSFDTVLPLIAAQAKVAIVCEGQPLHLTLTPKQATDLARRLESAGTSLEDIVKEVGGAYDYDAQRLSADTFLLTKRYTDQDDLPDMTFEEALASLQNILNATQNYCPPSGPEITLLEIIKTLTPDQKVPLAQGIPVADLPVQERQMAWQFACGNEFHGLSDLVLVARRLRACKERDTFFCHRRYLNLPITAYQGPFALNGLTDFFALSGWVDTTPGGGTTLDEGPGVHVRDNQVVVAPGTQDPTNPLASAPPVPASKLRVTLADLAKRLSGRSAAGGGGVAPVQVDPALARKTLCLAGEGFAAPDGLIKAVCAMYGVERHDGYTTDTITISLPRPAVVTATGEIKSEMIRLLPTAFLRAVKAAGAQNTFMQTAGSDYSTKRGDRLYIASVRRLRGIVEPLLAKSPRQQLPIPDAGNEARDLVALSSLAKCISDVQSLTVPSSPYMDNFNDAKFTLSQNAGDPNTFAYGFIYKMGQGQASGITGEMGYPQGTFGYGRRTGPGTGIVVGPSTSGM